VLLLTVAFFVVLMVVPIGATIGSTGL